MKKQEKKFVLAGLALLAITGLLALAGCKNDTVPEPTRYTVKFDKNAEDASGEMQSQIFTEGVEQELSVNQFKRAVARHTAQNHSVFHFFLTFPCLPAQRR